MMMGFGEGAALLRAFLDGSLTELDNDITALRHKIEEVETELEGHLAGLEHDRLREACGQLLAALDDNDKVAEDAAGARHSIQEVLAQFGGY